MVARSARPPWRLSPVNPPLPRSVGPALLVLTTAGCEEEQCRPGAPPTTAKKAEEDAASPSTATTQGNAGDDDRKVLLLRSVLQLIEDAATTPGGKNLVTAGDYLNAYFEGTSPSVFALDPETRQFLLEQKFGESAFADRERPRFDQLSDTLHIQDCLLYQAVATHEAGQGDDLTRVRRVFDWVTRNVLLVPPEYLSTPGVIYQAQARPYDVLVRGRATEADGTWAGKKEKGYWPERGWVFMVLCRQLGVDVGLVTITPKDQEVHRFWAWGALIDGKIYLFDARLGIAIPGPDGRSVATLDQILDGPGLL